MSALSPAIPLRGDRGAIKWYHQTAADVLKYKVFYSQDTRQWTLRGGVKAPNPFTLQQRPLLFVAFVKGGNPLVWPIEQVQIVDGRLTARLGNPL